jgi:alkylation response protein AidB-like acyl-CoA dehydrogenase
LVGAVSLAVAAAASGVMADAYERALRYAAERYQGGRMIIEHSHLREILGTMSAAARSSAALVREAARDPDDADQALAVKIAVTEQAVSTCTDAVQVLGGYGYVRDYGVEKSMRDAATLSLLPMSNIHARLLLAAQDEVASGGPGAASRQP